MPIMIRPKGLPKKIAYGILGVPANIKNKKPAFGERIQRLIQQQNTMRIK